MDQVASYCIVFAEKATGRTENEPEQQPKCETGKLKGKQGARLLSASSANFGVCSKKKPKFGRSA